MNNSEIDLYTETGTTVPIETDIFPPVLYVILAIVVSFMFLFGVAGNGTALWIFIRTKSLRTPPNVLIMNLIVSDLGMVVVNLPVMFASCFTREWILGYAGCQTYGFLGALFGIMSITNMSAIAMDRCYAICWSLKAVHTVTCRRSMVIIAIVWSYAVFWAVLPFIGLGSYVIENHKLSCTFEYTTHDLNHYVHVSLLFISSFILPVTIIIVCFGKMTITVRRHRKELAITSFKLIRDSQTRRYTIRQAKQAKTEYQIAKVGVTSTLMFATAWMPYAIVAVIGQFIDPDLLTPMGTLVPVVFAKSSAIWNPLIYALSHQNFSKALRQRYRNLTGWDYRHARRGSLRSMSDSRRVHVHYRSSTVTRTTSIPIDYKETPTLV